MDPAENHIPDEHRRPRWLPQDHRVHQEWLSGIVNDVENSAKELHPVIKEFRDIIEGETRLYLLFTSMFDQIPNKEPYTKNPGGQRQIRSYEHMLKVLNHMLTTAPSWNEKSERVGLVGLPINAMLDWPMGTQSGFAIFLDPEVNAMIKKVLNAWGEYLSSPASAAVLDTHSSGWFGEIGKKDLTATANVGESSHAFEDLFVCDPTAKHYGFNSWDHFFTRTFREGVRPVAGPDDPNVIANAPVTGKIVKAFVKDGTYYSEPQFEEFSETHGADESGESTAQGYITATATRAIIFIEADNPAIGLMVFVGVGMAEVSTCQITVVEGQHIAKGDEIGKFHFGGSTHTLLFNKNVDVQGFPEPGREHNVP
ncbi:MAG: hypothetical protein Q9217_005253, partial [Psora testacea]